MQKDVYTIRDIAKQLQVNEKTIRNLIAGGGLQAKKSVRNGWSAPKAFKD